MSTDLACSCWRAALQCSAAHEGEQLGQAPSEKCSGWLQRELEKGHAACFPLKLFQKTKRTKEKKKDIMPISSHFFLYEHFQKKSLIVQLKQIL